MRYKLHKKGKKVKPYHDRMISIKENLKNQMISKQTKLLFYQNILKALFKI